MYRSPIWMEPHDDCKNAVQLFELLQFKGELNLFVQLISRWNLNVWTRGDDLHFSFKFY